MYEYGIIQHNFPDELWLGPYEAGTEEEEAATRFIEAHVSAGGNPEVFIKVRREVKQWEKI